VVRMCEKWYDYMQPGWCQPVRQEFMENECEALPGVAYPRVRDNRSTINTKTGYDDDDETQDTKCGCYRTLMLKNTTRKLHMISNDTLLEHSVIADDFEWPLSVISALYLKPLQAQYIEKYSIYALN